MLSIIVPVYNEAETIQAFYYRLASVLKSMKVTYEIVFVDDGSIDDSSCIIAQLSKSDQAIRLISFTRNFGHQYAVSAGLDFCQGDVAITIDADLQDPPEIIPKLYQKWRGGALIVSAKRKIRNGETLFKKVTASLFYNVLNRLTDIQFNSNVGDFRLIDRKVIEQLKKIGDYHLYLRGLISWTGFTEAIVYYERDPRFGGESKYTINKMLSLSLNAITSFASAPLRFFLYMGLLVSGISFCLIIYFFYIHFFTSSTIVGWTSIVTLISFFSGTILLVLAIIAEYVGRIFEQVKQRPKYILKDNIINNK